MATTTGTAVTVTPHEGACGASVTGVRLAGLSDTDFAAVLAAWHTYGVLAFPGQHLSAEEHVAFSRRLGQLENTNTKDRDSTEHRPTTLALSNVNRRGELVADPEARLNRYLRSNQHWHTDSSFKRISAKASMLVAVEVPDEGGETDYADMRAAYDALDPALQARLEGLVAVHSIAWSQSLAMGEDDVLSPEEQRYLPPVRHPLVRVHEPTGRPRPVHRPPRPADRGVERRREPGPARRAAGGGLPATPGLPPQVAGRRRRAVGQPLHAPPGPPLGHQPGPGDAPHHDRRRPVPGRHQRVGALREPGNPAGCFGFLGFGSAEHLTG